MTEAVPPPIKPSRTQERFQRLGTSGQSVPGQTRLEVAGQNQRTRKIIQIRPHGNAVLASRGKRKQSVQDGFIQSMHLAALPLRS